MGDIHITLATSNPGKVREIQGYFDQASLHVVISLPPAGFDVDETGSTFLENARLKAEQTPASDSSQWILAEDSGFMVPALAGKYDLDPFPGVHSKRWMTNEVRKDLLGIDSSDEITFEEINRGILKLMNSINDRRASYIGVMSLKNVATGECFDATGEVALEVITDSPRGTQGFGYDPITLPIINGITSAKTMAEISTQEKNSLSHRGKALQKIIDYLEKL